MIKSNNIPYYLAGLTLFILLKFGFTYADNDALLFLLKPTNGIISLTNNSSAVYSNEMGFHHERLNIVIDRSCSGFNFWILSFVLFLFTSLKELKTKGAKTLAFPITLAGAYFITIMVNSSRILTSMLMNDLIGNQYDWMHQAQGAFIYLSFLILCYLLLNYSLKRFYNKNEKLA